VHKRQKLE